MKRIILVVVSIFAVTATIVLLSMYADLLPSWTGIPGSPTTPSKNLFDWIELLIVPIAIAVVGFILSRNENRYLLNMQTRKEKESREIEEKRFQENTLQSLIDYISQLLLEKNLRESDDEDEVRTVARSRLITGLRILDGEKRSLIIQFLYESKLIGTGSIQDDKFKSISPVIDLSDANLQSMKFGVLNFLGINISKADLSHSDLSFLVLMGSEFNICDFTDCNLDGVSFQESRLWMCKFDNSTLELASLDKSEITRSTFVQANCRGMILANATALKTNFFDANLVESNLSGTDFTGSIFVRANLTEANLTGTNLTNATALKTNFRNANLAESNLSGTDFTGSTFVRANLTGANLTGANLTSADLTGADLTGADLTGANLTGAIILRKYLKSTQKT